MSFAHIARYDPKGVITRFAATAPLPEQAALVERLARLLPQFRDWPRHSAGLPLGMIDGRPVFLPLEGHSLNIGGTGEGKFTSNIALLGLHDVRDSAGKACGLVFVDPKNGEAARLTGPFRGELRPERVFVLDPYSMAGGRDALNPFDFIDPCEPEFYESCAGLAKALVVQRPMDKRGNDFIWDSRGAEWLTAMIAHLALDPDEERTIMRLRQIFSSNEDNVAAVLADMRENPASPVWVRNAAEDMDRVTRKAEREASGYIATIKEATQFADSTLMAATLTHSTFDPIVVREDAASLYIVATDRYARQCAPWLRLMCEVTRQRITRSRINRHVHWVIDEARQFEAWSFIEDGIRAMRGAGVSLHLFYQNIGQMKGVWGEGWSALTDARIIRFLGSSDVETCKWIAELAGEVTVVDYSRADNDSESEGRSDAEGVSTSTALGKSISNAQSSSTAEGTSRTKTSSQSTAKGRSTSEARSRSASETHGVNWSETFGRSRTVTLGLSEGTSQSHSFGDSFSSTSGYGPGGGSGSFSSGNNSSRTFGSSQTLSVSVADGVSHAQTEGGSYSQAVTQGETRTEGASHTDTESSGVSNGVTHTDTEGRTRTEGETSTATEGESRTQTRSHNESRGITQTRTERRRLLTVDEVRRMSRRSVLLFVDRQADCLVERLHYHETPPLAARVLGPLARRMTK